MDEADRAHALALLLLPYARDLIDGPTPNHLAESPEPGSGHQRRDLSLSPYSHDKDLARPVVARDTRHSTAFLKPWCGRSSPWHSSSLG